MSKRVKGKVEVVHGKYAYKKKIISIEGNPSILKYVHSELSDDGIKWLMKSLSVSPPTFGYDISNGEELFNKLDTYMGKALTKTKSYIIITYTPCTQAR